MRATADAVSMMDSLPLSTVNAASEVEARPRRAAELEAKRMVGGCLDATVGQ